MAPRSAPASRVRAEEVNWITQWMTQLSMGIVLGVACVLVLDLLGFGVSGGGGADPDPLGLGFGSASYKVGDGGWVMFRSMVLTSPSSTCS
jgi:hypothetical protein